MPDSPEPWIQTPAFLQDRAKRVQAGLSNINDEISRLAAAGRIASNGSRWLAWKREIEAWSKWYGDATMLSTWLWSGTAATLDHYEQSIASWQSWLRQTFPDVAPNLVSPPMQYTPMGSPKNFPWMPLALGAGAVVALAVYMKR